MKRSAALSAITALLLALPAGITAWAADEPPPPYRPTTATAGTLSITLGTALGAALTALLVSISQANTATEGPDAGRVYLGESLLVYALGGAAGALASGPLVAWLHDPEQPWWSGVAAGLAGGLVAGSGAAVMVTMRSHPPVDPMPFIVIGLGAPVLGALTSGLAYQGVRQWECPQPSPTPRPLPTPWPSPTPPVRLWH